MTRSLFAEHQRFVISIGILLLGLLLASTALGEAASPLPTTKNLASRVKAGLRNLSFFRGQSTMATDTVKTPVYFLSHGGVSGSHQLPSSSLDSLLMGWIVLAKRDV